MTSKTNPLAESMMLIRRPVTDVFNAFIEPTVTSKFWFTESTGPLKEGETVTWTWGQFGASAEIHVTELKKNSVIRFQWPAGKNASNHRTVELTFEPQPENTTFVHVQETGFDQADENIIAEIVQQTQGWALVLSALKALIEHDIILTVVADHASPG